MRQDTADVCFHEMLNVWLIFFWIYKSLKRKKTHWEDFVASSYEALTRANEANEASSAKTHKDMNEFYDTQSKKEIFLFRSKELWV